MRYVVLDVSGTIPLPAASVSFGHLLHKIAKRSTTLALISLISVVVPYVFTVFMFILSRCWQFIAWMIIYVLALPTWVMMLPSYCLWRQNDFSWGDSRIILEKGSKGDPLVMEYEEILPANIPLRTGLSMRW